MNEGWVKVYRDFTKWEWYSDIKIARVFIHLLLTVNHKAARWKGIDIQPGQRIVSRESLAKETGLGIQEVRTALNKLKSTSEITIETTSKFTIISLVNWRKYQRGEVDTNQVTNQQINQQLTNVQPAPNQQVTTNKNEKNEKNDKNEKNINYSTFFSVDVEKFSNKQQKHCYGRFNNVLLTDGEVAQLKARFGSGYTEKLERFSHGLELKGYTYNNHYLAMLEWFGKEESPEEDILLMNMANVPVFRLE